MSGRREAKRDRRPRATLAVIVVPRHLGLPNHRVFEITLGKSDAELKDFLAGLRGREKVRVACIELSSSYRALIVADRFPWCVWSCAICSASRPDPPRLAWNLPWLTLFRTRWDRLTPEQRQLLSEVFRRKPTL